MCWIRQNTIATQVKTAILNAYLRVFSTVLVVHQDGSLFLVYGIVITWWKCSIDMLSMQVTINMCNPCVQWQKWSKTYMYSWSRQQIVLCQAIQASQWQMSGGLIQIPCEQGMSNKIRMEDWYSHYWVYILWFVGHPIFELGSMLVTRILNQTTRGQILWRSIRLETSSDSRWSKLPSKTAGISRYQN